MQVVGFDCAGIERLSVPQPNSCLLPVESQPYNYCIMALGFYLQRVRPRTRVMAFLRKQNARLKRSPHLHDLC